MKLKIIVACIVYVIFFDVSGMPSRPVNLHFSAAVPGPRCCAYCPVQSVSQVEAGYFNLGDITPAHLTEWQISTDISRINLRLEWLLFALLL